MTTLALPKLEAVRYGPTGIPKHTIGWEILGWTSEYLRLPDGPNAGDPWVFTDEQAKFVLWWYATDPTGRRFIYRRGMFRRLKGHGKDPLGAALCSAELLGPCRPDGLDASGEVVAKPHPAPWVITAAVSQDQTRNTMALFSPMLSEAAINEFSVDLGKVVIYARGGTAILEAVTSSPRAIEGKRQSFALKNEPHHWLPNNDGIAMSEVIERNLVKSSDGSARALSISNAHNPGEGSDAEIDYDAFLEQLATGSPIDVLYDSVEAPVGIDIKDEEQVRAAIRICKGDSHWLNEDRITATILDPRTREGEARRFYFNQVVAGDDVWLDRAVWDALKADQLVPPKTPIVIGFDGSYTDDWTVIRCETIDGFQFTPRFPNGKPMIWNPAKTDGYIPRSEIHAAIQHLMKTYKVERMYADPYLFQSELDTWSAEYGDKVVLSWATNRVKAMAECLERFRTDVLLGSFRHDGCSTTSKHVENAHAEYRPAGVIIRKDRHISPNKIDAVMSSALAHEAAFDAKADGWGSKNKKLTRVTGRIRGY